MKLYRVILFPATTMTRVLWSMLRPFVHGHVQVRPTVCLSAARLCVCANQDGLLWYGVACRTKV